MGHYCMRMISCCWLSMAESELDIVGEYAEEWRLHLMQ